MSLLINNLIDNIKETYKEKEITLKKVAPNIVSILEEKLKEEKLDNYKVSFRVKDIASLSEKIIRNKYLLELEKEELNCPSSVCNKIIERQTDLIGIKIQCRFICDEEKVFNSLKNIFDKAGVCKGNNKLHLQITKKQPEQQSNGFDIYRIDGSYQDDTEVTYKFELQIKSLVNSFWGDIEHEVIYKNSSVMLEDSELFNELMKTIYFNLNTIDNQLVRMYDSLTRKENFDNDAKKIMEKIIYNFFHEPIVIDFNININIKHICTLVSEYYYSKSRFKNTKDITTVIGDLINAVNVVNIANINFIEEKNISITSFPNQRLKTLFEIMDSNKSVIPEWNILLNILTSISRDAEENVIISYLNEIYKKIELPEVYAPLEDVDGIDRSKIKEMFINNIIDSMKRESSINVFLNLSINRMIEITETLIENIVNIEEINFENTEDDNIAELHKFLLDFSYKNKVKLEIMNEKMEKLKNITWISLDENYLEGEYLKYEDVYKLIKL